jgi:hypothetical protein
MAIFDDTTKKKQPPVIGGPFTQQKAAAPTTGQPSVPPPATIPSLGGMSVDDFFANTQWRQQYGRDTEANRQRQLAQQAEAQYWWDQAMRGAPDERARGSGSTTLNIGGMNRGQYYQDKLAEFQRLYPGINVNQQTGRVEGGELPQQIDWSNVQTDTIEDENGNTIATGYWYNNEFFIDRDLRGRADQQGELRDLLGGFQTPDQWMEEQGKEWKDPWAVNEGMQSLIEQWQNPEYMQDLYKEGYGQYGEMAGIDDFTGHLAGQRERIKQGPGAYEGLSPERSAAYERQRALAIQDAEERSKWAIEAIAGESTSRAFSMASELSSQIADMDIQLRFKKLDAQEAIQAAQWEQEQEAHKRDLQAGRESATEYIQAMRDNAVLRLQMYGQELSLINQTHQDYFMRYGADQQAILQHASLMYNDIVSGLQIDAETQAQIQTSYDRMMAPYENAMRENAQRIAEMGVRAQQSANVFEGILGFLGIGVKIAGIASDLKEKD